MRNSVVQILEELKEVDVLNSLEQKVDVRVGGANQINFELRQEIKDQVKCTRTIQVYPLLNPSSDSRLENVGLSKGMVLICIDGDSVVNMPLRGVVKSYGTKLRDGATLISQVWLYTTRRRRYTSKKVKSISPWILTMLTFLL